MHRVADALGSAAWEAGEGALWMGWAGKVSWRRQCVKW